MTRKSCPLSAAFYVERFPRLEFGVIAEAAVPIFAEGANDTTFGHVLPPGHVPLRSLPVTVALNILPRKPAALTAFVGRMLMCGVARRFANVFAADGVGTLALSSVM
jgi:hypothetical protein